jgi:hypothetical protein
MSRRTALMAVAMFCLVIPACIKADKRVNRANFDKIKPGMTRDEVTQLLGPWEDDVGDAGLGSSAGAVGVGTWDTVSSGTPALRWARYGTDNVHIKVCFNRQDKVHDTEFKKEKGLK